MGHHNIRDYKMDLIVSQDVQRLTSIICFQDIVASPEQMDFDQIAVSFIVFRHKYIDHEKASWVL